VNAGPALRPLLLPVALMAFRPSVTGSQNVPRTGPVILAANHLSVIDSFLIPLLTPRRVSFLGKQEYFEGGNPKKWAVRTLLTGLDVIAVPRSGFRAAQESLEIAKGVLDGGGAFGIHPEGSRSRDGQLYRGHTGVAWLALATGAPVVPVAVKGTERIQPVGTRVPRPGKVTVSFGAPLRFSLEPGARPGPARRKVTDEIMTAIAELSGQTVADRYNDHSAGQALSEAER
jgi:1-acyl-sn-glycerol-3-phosphate acyltransferase